MAKKNKRKKSKPQGTNWWLIGGIVGVGFVGLLVLFFLSTNQPEAQSLTDYCDENKANCVTDGDINAPVTIIEISDFGCPHCRDFHQQTLPRLEGDYIASGQVRWVSFPYALRLDTMPAANAALCADEQQAYFEFSEAIFSQSDQLASLTEAGFLQAATEVNLEMDSFQECLAENRYMSDVEANVEAAREAGVSATPTFLINGRKLEGAHPFATFQQQIDQLLGS